MFEQVRKILAEEIGVDESEITIESNLSEDLGVDSMDLYNLLDALEAGLQLNISDDSEIVTVGDIVDLVERLKRQN